MDEKVKLRKMHNNLELNKYLGDSDSILEDFKSVGSDDIHKYEDIYSRKHRLVGNGKPIGRTKFKIHKKGTNC